MSDDHQSPGGTPQPSRAPSPDKTLVRCHLEKLLQRWKAGDPDAQQEVFHLVEPVLRRSIRSYLTGEACRWWFDTTEMLDDVYLELCGEKASVEDMQHFYRLAATMTARHIIDIVRAKKAKKNVDTGAHLPLEHLHDYFETRNIDVDHLVAAIEDLEDHDPWLKELTNYKIARYTEEEIARISRRKKEQIRKDWAFVRVWLMKELRKSDR